MSTMRPYLGAVCLALALVGSGFPTGADAQTTGKIKVLIIDGVNNHDWKTTTAATKATLLATGRFAVDVSTSPEKSAAPEKWAEWKPDFAKYGAVFSNFNDGGKCRWSEATKKSLVDYVKGGGGLVIVHAADNSSSDWPEYNEMIAVGGWGGRNPGHGSLLRKALESWNPDPAPDGLSGSHGARWEFPVRTEEADHPIMKGLPNVWKHAADELYNSLRGPCKNVTVLASSPSRRTKTDEPMAMVINFGKGRVFHTPMGHCGGPGNVGALLCVGFQTLIARGTEFAATGKVTLPVPAEFPSKDAVSVVKPDEVKWGAAASGG